MGDSDEVAKRLRGLADKAKEHAKDASNLAEAADHAADIVTWTQENVVPFATVAPSLGPADYLADIEQAEEELLGANQNVSSARSYIEVVSSGTAAFASGSIADRVLVAPEGDPVFSLQLPEGNAAARRGRLAEKLEKLLPGKGLSDRLEGAWTAFYGGGKDNMAQAAHSMREILTTLLDALASVDDVKGAPWWEEAVETTHGVSKRQKIKFFLVGEADLDDARVERIDKLVSEAHRAHGAAVKAAHHSLAAGETAIRNALIAFEEVIEQLVDTREALRNAT